MMVKYCPDEYGADLFCELSDVVTSYWSRQCSRRSGKMDGCTVFRTSDWIDLTRFDDVLMGPPGTVHNFCLKYKHRLNVGTN